MEEEIVYAIHNFEASVEDEISLEAGEAIVVIEKDDLYNDGWWQGKNSRGEIGLFPMNFISTTNPQSGNGLMGRYANLLSEGEAMHASAAHEEQQTAPNLGGRLSDPMMHSVLEDNRVGHSPAMSSSESDSEPIIRSPPPPATSSNVPLSSATSAGGMNRSASSKKPSSGELPDEAMKRTLTSNTPLTPNRSSFRQSVRFSSGDVSKLMDLPDPSQWNNQQVVDWLIKGGFESVAPLFVEHEITGDILVKLDLNTLKDIGILAFGKRFNLNNQINNLKTKYGLTSPTAAAPPTSGGSDNKLNNPNQSQQHPSSASSPTTASSDPSSEDPPPPSKEVGSPPPPPVDHDLYPLEDRKANQLTQKVQALALGSSSNRSVNLPPGSVSSTSSGDPHSHVQQWLQEASEYDYDHDLTKEAGISSPPENRSVMSAGTESYLHAFEEDPTRPPPPPPHDSSYVGSSPSNHQNYSSVGLKKQVSFSQNHPEVIGVSMAPNAFDEEEILRERAALNKHQQNPPPPPRNDSGGSGPPRMMDLFPSGGDPTHTRTFNVEPVGGPLEDHGPHHLPVSGWLKKQEGPMKLWKQRWCELEGSSLRVWDSPKRKKAKVILDLRGYKPVLDPNLNPGKFCFKLVHPTNKSHGFASDEAGDIRNWMKALMKVSIDRDVSAPVVTSCTVNTVPLHVARKLAPRPPSAMLTGNNASNGGGSGAAASPPPRGDSAGGSMGHGNYL